jgi:prophage DNA circulation protein
MADFSRSLRTASWRGVSFGLEMGSESLGRRKVRHDYPYRDTVWLEDQGKLPRSFRLAGFLIGHSAVYGGGDVKSQLKKMETAAEAKGAGVLVHPSRGRLTVDLMTLVISERWDEGNYYALDFEFIQGGQQLFPAVLGALGDLVSKAAGLADAAGLGAFVSSVTGPLQQGLNAAEAMASTASGWLGQAQSLARDATSLYGTVSQLGGADFGRYFNGRNSGFLEGLTSAYAGASSISDLISAGSLQRGLLSAASGRVQAAISGLGVTATAADVGSAALAAVGALRATAADPSDGVRILGDLSRYVPSGLPSGTLVGAETSKLFRRSAAVALARVSATYAPASADDANAVRAAVLGPLDREIVAAGNSGADEVFATLRDLRKAVVQDLGERGGSLSRLVQVALPSSLPAVVIAQQRYGAANRGGELVTQADPIHPWFMPTAITALGG